MKKIICQPYTHPGRIKVWKQCAPFYQNPRGVLLHRVRTAYTFIEPDGSPRHSVVQYWCGNSAIVRKSNSYFTDSPSETQLLCRFCEMKAVYAGQESADQIAGHHVHQGKARAIQTCCSKGQQQP